MHSTRNTSQQQIRGGRRKIQKQTINSIHGKHFMSGMTTDFEGFLMVSRVPENGFRFDSKTHELKFTQPHAHKEQR